MCNKYLPADYDRTLLMYVYRYKVLEPNIIFLAPEGLKLLCVRYSMTLMLLCQE